MRTPLRTRHRLTYVLAALSVGALITAAAVPQRARAADSSAQLASQAGAAADQRCSSIPPGFGHPPLNLSPRVLQLPQPSVEPVPATDGLIHLPYVAQVTNTAAQPVHIVSVVPVDPLAGFGPTGRNLITDPQGRSVAGQVELFVTSPDDTVPDDGLEAAESVPGFSTRVLGGNSGLMYFDVTYTDPDQVPRLLAHAITLAAPVGGGRARRRSPTPCRSAACSWPCCARPWSGTAGSPATAAARSALYHRVDTILPFNGVLQGSAAVRHRLPPVRAEQRLLQRAAHGPDLLVGLRHAGPSRGARRGRLGGGRDAGPAARGHDHAPARVEDGAR